jgi:hypothetical protein
MTDPVPHDASSPPVDPPVYIITSGSDGVLRWHPPAGSAELALALSYHFPRPETLEDKMQAAILRYIRASKKQASHKSPRASLVESQTKFKIMLPSQTQAVVIDDLLSQTFTASYDTNASSQPLRTSNLVWNVSTGEELLGKPKKRQYTQEEQAEITKNRGNACDYHRRTKKKVCTVQTAGGQAYINEISAMLSAVYGTSSTNRITLGPITPAPRVSWIAASMATVMVTTLGAITIPTCRTSKMQEGERLHMSHIARAPIKTSKLAKEEERAPPFKVPIAPIQYLPVLLSNLMLLNFPWTNFRLIRFQKVLMAKTLLGALAMFLN